MPEAHLRSAQQSHHAHLGADVGRRAADILACGTIVVLRSSNLLENTCVCDLGSSDPRHIRKAQKLSKSSIRREGCRLRRRRFSRRRRPDERIGFVALSRGEHPSSTPDTTIRDLCLILSRVDACCLPATRAGICEREPDASAACSHIARVRAGIHEVRTT